MRLQISARDEFDLTPKAAIMVSKKRGGLHTPEIPSPVANWGGESPPPQPMNAGFQNSVTGAGGGGGGGFGNSIGGGLGVEVALGAPEPPPTHGGFRSSLLSVGEKDSSSDRYQWLLGGKKPGDSLESSPERGGEREGGYGAPVAFTTAPLAPGMIGQKGSAAVRGVSRGPALIGDDQDRSPLSNGAQE